MKPEVITGLLGAGLPIVFTFFPGLRTWYETLRPNQKGGIMLGLVLLIGMGGLVPVCLGWFTAYIPLTCDQAGIEGAVIATLSAAAGYATTYLTIASPVNKTREANKL